jgi:hypothetical protein
MKDPYQKIYHKAHLVREDGAMSPLCASKPRVLKLDRELATMRWEAVTCERCLSLKPRD